MKVFRYIFVFVFLFIPFVGNAQVSYFDNLAISVSPENPRPGEDVTLRAQSFAFDINQSYFTWYIDGFVVNEGFGEDVLTFHAGKSNERSLITLTVSTENNNFLEEQITIQPVDVTLLWQANTSVPTFYKGKALHTPGSDVKFVAISNVFQNGIKVSSRNLVYTWKNNNKILGSLSGIGKSSITLENKGILRDFVVSVSVSTADGLVSGRDTVVIDVVNPEVLFYEDSPLLGKKYEKAIGDDFILTRDEVVIAAESFFFSTGDLLYSWRIDRQSLGNTENNILLKSPEEGGSLSNISVEVKHPDHFLQVARAAFDIKFNVPLLESLFNF